MADRFVIDHLATLMRKPTSKPLLTPPEAVAIALTSSQWVPGRLHEPDSPTVALVLKCLEDAGWKLEPICAERLDG